MGFYWDSNRNACLPDCNAIPGARVNALDPTVCLCEFGLGWNGTNCTNQPIITLTTVNCSNIPYSSGSNPSNLSSCICLGGYTWLDTQCVYDCSSIPNSNTTNSNTTACFCKPGYSWRYTNTSNTSTPTGICQINCTTVVNSDNTSSSSNSCNCIDKYSWNNNTNLCEINCSGIDKASGSYNSTVCNCNSGYVWRDNVCVRNCTGVRFANGSDFTNVSSCKCKEYYVWKEDRCEPDCSSMPYTKKEEKSNGSCKCDKNYRWEDNIGMCVSKKGGKTGLVLGLALGIPLGILGLAGLGALLASMFWPSAELVPMPVMISPGTVVPVDTVTKTPIVQTINTVTQGQAQVLPQQQIVQTYTRPIVSSIR